ncbi:hypothetical protein ACTI_49180 [Actinoplanes sp. OR16]|uniref:hypothetical protein n=1 Tax=Actinoplanes sp. OR16 TaxID=946334 RepID=UPI000F6D6F8F|nr:hypothetical protein [Actinoplanes sp. OR16]BBH68233.1 hypothetical protein ACTI_49180 [Actinoplanes sp. OR16]
MTTNRDDHLVALPGPPATPEPGPRVVASLCGTGTCPTVYSTDRDTVLVQGYAVSEVDAPDGELVVEIPREVLLQAAARLIEERGA